MLMAPPLRALFNLRMGGLALGFEAKADSWSNDAG